MDDSPMAPWDNRARTVLPAGGLGNFDPSIFIREGKGSRVWDITGREYVDYLIGSGPMLLGHGHPEVLNAVMEQLPRGITFFTNNTAAVALAEEICKAVACAEQVRFLTSGGEANMYAMRLARAFTGRDKIVKFEGGFHGMSAEAQMSVAPTQLPNFPQAIPDSAGIPAVVRADMLVAPYNDANFLESLLKEYGTKVAAVIVEPLQRVIPPAPDFLQASLALCQKHGVVLIFDEIVTGFRFAYGGAQEEYGVTPDLCTLGKVIGGGFPLAAVAGRKTIMDHFDKDVVGNDRWLMMLGTLSGNPVAAVAGLKTLEILRRPGAFARLRANGQRLQAMFTQHLSAAGIKHQIIGHPTLFNVAFTDKDIRTYRDFQSRNMEMSVRFNAVLRKHGILKWQDKLYPSLALTDDDFALTDTAIVAAVGSLSAM